MPMPTDASLPPKEELEVKEINVSSPILRASGVFLGKYCDEQCKVRFDWFDFEPICNPSFVSSLAGVHVVQAGGKGSTPLSRRRKDGHRLWLWILSKVEGIVSSGSRSVRQMFGMEFADNGISLLSKCSTPVRRVCQGEDEHWTTPVRLLQPGTSPRKQPAETGRQTYRVQRPGNRTSGWLSASSFRQIAIFRLEMERKKCVQSVLRNRQWAT